MNVYIPTGDITYMQGPCPEGFHVPTGNEWNNVITIMSGLNLPTTSNWVEKLHLPNLGYRANDGNLYTGESYYWACTSLSTSSSTSTYGQSLWLHNGNVSRNNAGTCYGNPIRAFKNNFVIPTASWTVIQGTLGSAGIFRNQTDGLISITSDGTTGYTIQDRNLGATTVYNNGDTLSESNCGKLYQWGNCYGFSYSGTITTSSTKVDANTYGPGNYYSSSTFITSGSSPFKWDTSNNFNLRGGVTGPLKINELKNAYIGEYIDYKTFTISWTEKSDMSSGWTYSDDAAGLTAGSSAFDEFFGYYGCRLNSSGVETAKVLQSSPGVLDITQLGTLTSGDNVMIAFPRRGIKMSKSGSTVTISITDDPNKPGFQYYAFTRGTTVKDRFYLSAYKASRISNVLKSYSGQGAASSASANGISYISLNTACSHAQANGAGYDCETRWMRNYINALFVLKYKTLNSQSKVGAGYTGGSAAQLTGATNSITNATGATNTSNTGRIKIFGLEDWWGNVFEWLNGAYYNSSTSMQLGTLPESQSGRITNFSYYDAVTGTSSTAAITVAKGWMSSAVANNAGMFAGNGASGSDSTYYCDYFYVNSGYSLLAGGNWNYDTYAGAFFVDNNGASNANTGYGARLAFL